jgi:SAM-dependent MidA family methyltransferase
VSPADELRQRLRQRGAITFAEFMAVALYGEGGYYRRAALPIGAGPGADYATGSSLSPLFGAATARLLRRLDETLGRPADLLEVGYGGGEHLAAVAAALAAGPAAGPRRLLAHEQRPRPLPAGVEGLADLGRAAGAIRGLVFSYELFDALPVHRLVGGRDGLRELWVELAGDGGFAWREGPLSDPALAALLGGAAPASLVPGQVADLAPGWAPLYRQLAGTLRQGLLVTCDYGFERERLLDPRVRLHGTAAAYRRQRVHRDVLRDPGEQDLTAHVDFTALRTAGEAAGLATVAFTRQARWLLACGVFDGLAEAGVERRLDAMRLLDGEGMGEEIRVLVQAHEVDPAALFELRLLGA